MAVFLRQKLTHTCFSQLRSINEYLVTDWGGQDHWLGSNIMRQTGTCGTWCPVPELRHCQCHWMTLAKLQVDFSASHKTPRSEWRPCLQTQEELPPQMTSRSTSKDVEGLTFVHCYNTRWQKAYTQIPVSANNAMIDTINLSN